MAAPTYVSAGAGKADGTSATTTTFAYPASPASGDLMVFHMGLENTTSTVTTPSGWTSKWATDDSTDASTIRWRTYFHVSDGTESGNLTVTHSSTSNIRIGRIYLFRGTVADASTVDEGAATTSGNSTTISMPSVTTTAADRLVVALVGNNDNGALVSATGESGGDWTETVAEFTTASGGNGGLQLQTSAMAAAGTISGGSQTVSSVGWRVRAFALKPLSTAKTSSGFVNFQDPGWMLKAFRPNWRPRRSGLLIPDYGLTF